MARVTLDDFIEAFSAKLVAEGLHEIKLNDPDIRDGLFRVYRFLDSCLETPPARGDREWRRSLVNVKSVFQPSPIGSFDRFEALMRAKQTYLTDHPNPYYQDIFIRMGLGNAHRIIERLSGQAAELVSESVRRYMGAAAQRGRTEEMA